MKTNFFLFLFNGMLITGIAFAQTATPKVAKKQANQHARINEGVKSGELTKKEAAALRAREEKLQRDKKIAKSDGKVTPAERAKLNREANRNSKVIHNQKHDAQHR